MTEYQTLSPESILNQSLDKQRIVITGGRGKSSLTGMLIHVLSHYSRSFDYVVSSPMKGITETSKFSNAPVIIIEADEQHMHKYQQHIGLICNVIRNKDESPNEEEYVRQFDLFADNTPKGGILLYCENDPLAVVIGAKPRTDVQAIAYSIHPHTSDNGKHFLTSGKDRIPVQVFGSQNFQNISGAKELLKKIGINSQMFYQAISNFEQ